MQPSFIGTLIVRPQSAELLHNRDLFHKMDPYCVCNVAGQQKQTSVAKRQGKTPKWNDTLEFNVGGEHTLALTLYDKDRILKDAFIGESLIPLASVYQHGTHADWYILF